VGQEWHGDIRVILFVKLAEGRALSEELIEKITTIIRDNTTPRHIPAKIIAVDDIPYNFNGKRVELVVWNVVNNKPVPNVDSLVNPSSLDLYRNIKELQS
jgi:acetoacetyl-CoA synthetase